jgi:hypothetical protein
MIDKIKFIEELPEEKIFARMHIEEIREYNVTTILERSISNCFLDYNGLSLLSIDSVRAWLKLKECNIPLDRFSRLEIDFGIKVEGMYSVSYFHRTWDREVRGFFWAYDAEKLRNFS